MTRIRANDRVSAIVSNVRALRQDRGWTKPTLAAELAARGCPSSISRINKLEMGYVQTLTVDELWTLAEIFGLTIEQLALARVCAHCESFPPPAGFSCATCGAESR